jgi:hypothetical protein
MSKTTHFRPPRKYLIFQPKKHRKNSKKRPFFEVFWRKNAHFAPNPRDSLNGTPAARAAVETNSQAAAEAGG